MHALQRYFEVVYMRRDTQEQQRLLYKHGGNNTQLGLSWREVEQGRTSTAVGTAGTAVSFCRTMPY